MDRIEEQPDLLEEQRAMHAEVSGAVSHVTSTFFFILRCHDRMLLSLAATVLRLHCIWVVSTIIRPMLGT